MSATQETPTSAYAQAGVDIDAGKRATDLIKTAVEATYTPAVLAGLGAFGGLYSLRDVQHLREPLLVSSTDGVGTKTRVAARLNRWGTIGHDLVNHCVNDILVQGARPLFFLDYVASSQLDPEQIATIVRGIATACQAAQCALLGGETAEMPGVYQPNEIDLVGTIVGVVERDKLIDGSRIEVGDIVMGLPSSGLHTNGYTLAHAVLAEESWLDSNLHLGHPLGEVLLTPHRSYLPQIARLQEMEVDIHGLAHITGGGMVENLPRVLPEDTAVVINRQSWTPPPIFDLIQEKGSIAIDEMFRVFNMGLGMLVVVSPAQVSLVHKILGDDALEVGRIVSGKQTVHFEQTES
jgi:phosphoribosylformylglycinamidine cyclo-ligase